MWKQILHSNLPLKPLGAANVWSCEEHGIHIGQLLPVPAAWVASAANWEEASLWPAIHIVETVMGLMTLRGICWYLIPRPPWQDINLHCRENTALAITPHVPSSLCCWTWESSCRFQLSRTCAFASLGWKLLHSWLFEKFLLCPKGSIGFIPFGWDIFPGSVE